MTEVQYFEQFVGDIDEPWAVVHSGEYIHKYYPSYAEAERAKVRLSKLFPDRTFGLIPVMNGISPGMRIFPLSEDYE